MLQPAKLRLSMGEAAVMPHVLLVSFPGQGHVNPLLRLAKRIAAKGLLVTFSSTLDIGHKITASANATLDTPIPVGRGHLRFEFFPDGWDLDDHRRGIDLDALMVQLQTVCSSAVTDLIRRQAEKGQPVTCVINNPFIPWVLDIAEEFNIPSAVLWVQSSAVFSTYYHYFHSLAEFPSDSNSDVTVSIAGLPTLKPNELPTFLLASNPYKSLTEVILSQFSNIHKATWVFANSFEELEHDAIKALTHRSQIIPVGPLVDVDDEAKSDNIKGDFWKAADCIEWLDSQEPNSVVYVSVGSVVVLTGDEMAEMAFGLLSCKWPFLWVVRDNCQNLLPEGYMESIKGKGMVIPWSPQERVLTHNSVACFVTHCGWNSTLEVLTSGVPVIAYPQFGDQVPNAMFLVEVYGVGVRLKAPVERAELERCVGEVVKGEKADKMRERAMEWKEAARTAVGEGGSSDRNIQTFVDEVRRRASVCGGELFDQIAKS